MCTGQFFEKCWMILIIICFIWLGHFLSQFKTYFSMLTKCNCSVVLTPWNFFSKLHNYVMFHRRDNVLGSCIAQSVQHSPCKWGVQGSGISLTAHFSNSLKFGAQHVTVHLAWLVWEDTLLRNSRTNFWGCMSRYGFSHHRGDNVLGSQIVWSVEHSPCKWVVLGSSLCLTAHFSHPVTYKLYNVWFLHLYLVCLVCCSYLSCLSIWSDSESAVWDKWPLDSEIKCHREITLHQNIIPATPVFTNPLLYLSS